MTTVTEQKSEPRTLPEFRNEALTDFSRPEDKSAMEAALEKVKRELGRTHPLVIGGQRITGLPTFDSLNPANRNQVGKFQKGTKAHVEQAIEQSEVALSRHSERHFHALRDERVGEDFPAVPGLQIRFH